MINANSVHRVTPSPNSLVSVSLVPESELARYVSDPNTNVMGAVFYGNAPSKEYDYDFPQLTVELTQLGRESYAELWLSDTPFEQGSHGNIRYAKNSKLMFGYIDVPCLPHLQQQSEELGDDEQFNGDRQAGHNDAQNGFLGQVGLSQIALD